MGYPAGRLDKEKRGRLDLGSYVARGAALALGAATLVPVVSNSVEASGVATTSAPITPLSDQDVDLQFNPLYKGRVDFVISSFKYAIGGDAKKTGACPAGMTMSAMDAYGLTPEGKRKGGESVAAHGKRVREYFFSSWSNGPDACMSPELVGPDPHYQTVGISNTVVPGIDLDGQRSTLKSRPAAGTCAHDDFAGSDGAKSIDNQFYRAIGCTPGFQSTGSKNGFDTEMLTGSWGIVMSIRGIDNPVNDDEVEVGLHANADPIQLSPDRKPLTHMTYTVDDNPRFQSWTKGRIVNGVLTTDPVTVRFHHFVNAIALERPLDGARLRITFEKDGSIKGILAGYADVDALYDFFVGMRSGKDAKGNPAPLDLRRVTAGGSSASGGFTCNGLYHALKRLADGHRDPKTGKCASISTQYELKAIPAFIVEKPTAPFRPTRGHSK